MPLISRFARATLVPETFWSASFKFNKLLESYSFLLFYVFQSECLVGIRPKRVPNRFLTFVHTACRSYQVPIYAILRSKIVSGMRTLLQGLL